ncbi:MAG TPA: alpha/beta fold hydrolase [Blastocatellia bacterium]
MKNRIFSLALATLLISQLSLFSLAQSQPDVRGRWEGAITLPNGELDFQVNFARKEDGSWTGTIDIPSQGAKDLPLVSVSVSASAISFALADVPGDPTWKGKLSEDGKTIAGDFSQGGQTFPFKITKKTTTSSQTANAPAKPAEVKHPQEPQKPYPYDEEDVTYENAKGGVRLAGTLTLPRAKGPFAAVLLITGSGAQDRNEALLGHKPFLVLADHLTRRGIAVLRVDDRGVGGSTGKVAESTSDDFAGDVLAGIEYLETRKEIDPKKIGLIGHSEGGLIAPIVASRSKDVAFIVLMAGPGLTGEEIIYLQSALIARANGAKDEMIAQNRLIQEKTFAVIKQEKDNSLAEKKLLEINGATTEEQQKAAAPRIRPYLSTWFRYFLTYDPIPFLKQVRCPVLAINGELDLQVPYKENLAAIEAALKAGNNKDHTAISLPGLNHLFQNCKTGSPDEYAKIEETIAPVALQAISDWILKHAK